MKASTLYAMEDRSLFLPSLCVCSWSAEGVGVQGDSKDKQKVLGGREGEFAGVIVCVCVCVCVCVTQSPGDPNCNMINKQRQRTPVCNTSGMLISISQ